MNSILDNSIWPNLNGELGSITTPIPDGVTVKWPDGDALVGNFVYKDGKLVGFVDSKALIPNDTKSSNLPYDCVHTSFERILDGDFTFDGTRKNHFEIKCSDLVNFAKINLSEILSDVKFVIDLDDSSENKLVVHTDRVDDSKLEEVSTTLSNVLPANIEVAQYNHNMEISWRDINKYAACKTSADVAAVNPDFRNDVTSDGEWVYPFTSLVNGQNLMWINNAVKKGYFYAPNVTNLQNAFSGLEKMKEVIFYFPKATGAAYLFNNCLSLVKASGDLTKLADSWETFKNAPIEILECDFPSLSNDERFLVRTGTNDTRYGGRLNKPSTLRLLSSVPSYTSGTHKLGIGIHIDHQQDEEVLAAIANAEAKGWTLIVQWNGTPTAAASVMMFGQLIYAKVGEHELTDGTTERVLDWGHYVTDETGYETFRSLKSAYEHFDLEMPSIDD